MTLNNLAVTKLKGILKLSKYLLTSSLILSWPESNTIHFILIALQSISEQIFGAQLFGNGSFVNFSAFNYRLSREKCKILKWTAFDSVNTCLSDPSEKKRPAVRSVY